MFGRIMLGLSIMVLGGAMIYFSGNLVEIFGRSRWADEHLGGTREMRMFIGFGLVIIGGLLMFGIVSITNPADVDTATFN